MVNFLKKKKINIINLYNLNNKKDFIKLFNKLFEIGKRRILIESGLTFLNQLLKFGLINNLYLFKTNKPLKKKGFNNSSSNIIKKMKIMNKINVNLENENLFKLRIK